jgi:hypothetical protein
LVSILFVRYTDAECYEPNNLLHTVGSFQERVWLSLAKNIGPGKVVSYGELAKMVNSPGLSHGFINFSYFSIEKIKFSLFNPVSKCISAYCLLHATK